MRWLHALLVLAGLTGLTASPTAAVTLIEAGSGRLLGSATLIGGDRVLTNRHVVEPALRRGATIALVHDGVRVDTRIAGLSDRLDLAVLVAARHVADDPVLRLGTVAPDARVNARTPAGAVVAGAVTRLRWRDAWGPALFVRMPVVYGASGAAVRDADGLLVGLVTAAVNPDARQMMMLRSGTGGASAGLGDAPGDQAPIVLVLPIQAAIEEATRLYNGCCGPGSASASRTTRAPDR